MPGVYSEMHPYDFFVAGNLAVGAQPTRVTVPYAFEIEGVSASVATPAASQPIIVDVLYGPNGTAPGSLTSIFSVDTSKRPTIAAGAYDNAPVTGPDQPAVAGDTATEPSFTQYLARPTAPASTTFAGNQPVNTGNNPVTLDINASTPTFESGGPNQPSAAANTRWSGAAGGVLQLSLAQVGVTTTGANLSVIVWVLQK